tara:strand:- start:138 stop:482 length:345 start_codon:yes stop_codon:yes gene_type:complete
MKPKEIANLMLEKKALDIKIFDVKKITTMTDHFIICSTDSEPQTKAITVHIEKTMKKMGVKPISIEGQNKLEWVLMDYVSFIVHIFKIDKREFYDLDRLWADAKITSIQDKNEK